MAKKNRWFRAGLLATLTITSAYATANEGRYSLHTVNMQKIAEDCGPASNVGYSSVFGGYNQWADQYPVLGQASAEIEAIRAIDGGSKAAAREVFADAKAKKQQIVRSQRVTNEIVERNSPYYAVTPGIQQDTMGKYQDHSNKLAEENRFITDKAIQDLESALSEGGNDYDIWQTCRAYWSGYSASQQVPSGRHGGSSNEWWKD